VEEFKYGVWELAPATFMRLKIIRNFQSVNWLCENLLYQDFIAQFHEPPVTAIWIINGLVNKAVLHGIYVNVV